MTSWEPVRESLVDYSNKRALTPFLLWHRLRPGLPELYPAYLYRRGQLYPDPARCRRQRDHAGRLCGRHGNCLDDDCCQHRRTERSSGQMVSENPALCKQNWRHITDHRRWLDCLVPDQLSCFSINSGLEISERTKRSCFE